MMGILYHAITNPNYRPLSEDELAEYEQQARERRYEQQQARRQAENDARHPSDSDRWEE